MHANTWFNMFSHEINPVVNNSAASNAPDRSRDLLLHELFLEGNRDRL
jgi:hypothetical protein